LGKGITGSTTNKKNFRNFSSFSFIIWRKPAQSWAS